MPRTIITSLKTGISTDEEGKCSTCWRGTPMLPPHDTWRTTVTNLKPQARHNLNLPLQENPQPERTPKRRCNVAIEATGQLEEKDHDGPLSWKREEAATSSSSPLMSLRNGMRWTRGASEASRSSGSLLNLPKSSSLSSGYPQMSSISGLIKS